MNVFQAAVMYTILARWWHTLRTLQWLQCDDETPSHDCPPELRSAGYTSAFSWLSFAINAHQSDLQKCYNGLRSDTIALYRRRGRSNLEPALGKLSDNTTHFHVYISYKGTLLIHGILSPQMYYYNSLDWNSRPELFGANTILLWRPSAAPHLHYWTLAEWGSSRLLIDPRSCHSDTTMMSSWFMLFYQMSRRLQ